jgi:hypothetical protein
LVDTIIDLRLDDAPLIVKKGFNGDKCVSCNQLINSTNLVNSPSSVTIANYSEFNDRHKIKNIQDISNKYGLGSYSRILSNFQPDSIIEDLTVNQSKSRKNAHSVHLPDIDTNSNVKSNMEYRSKRGDPNGHINNNGSVTLTPGKNTLDNSLDRKINSLIFQMEKKNMKGGEIIRSVDKIYDTLDKANK